MTQAPAVVLAVGAGDAGGFRGAVGVEVGLILRAARCASSAGATGALSAGATTRRDRGYVRVNGNISIITDLILVFSTKIIKTYA